MTAVQKVLVASDFSACAERALEWAVALSKAHGASLHLVHAMPRINAYELNGALTARLRRQIAGQLQKLAASVLSQGVNFGWSVVDGAPSSVIREKASTIGADVIVLGNRGLTGFRHLVLGSTAERVVQRSPCPVLTVHPGDVHRGETVRVALVPTDFSEDAKLATRRVAAIFNLGRSGERIVLLHAVSFPRDCSVYGVDFPEDLRERIVRNSTAALEDLAAPLRREGLTVEIRVEEGAPPEVICRRAERDKVDLIAMGTHGRAGLGHLFLGSVAERVVQHAPCPVLTMRRSRPEHAMLPGPPAIPSDR